MSAAVSARGCSTARSSGLLRTGAGKLTVNTNTLDHPGALGTYRKAGFRLMRSETRELRDPRVLWPDLYRWPPV